MVEGMLNLQMIEDITYLILERMKSKERRMIIIINNRAGGNASTIAQLTAEKFLVTKTY
jgi:hypothetical protein